VRVLSVSQKKEKTSAAIRTTWKKTPRTLASFANFENVLNFRFIFDRSKLIYLQIEKRPASGRKLGAILLSI
jgi:hypothetical protein